MSTYVFRKDLSIPGMLDAVHQQFSTITDTVVNRGISLSDCLMSGLAVFVLKFPSLLQFDQALRDGEEPVRALNLRTLFKVIRVPADTTLRERLDRVDPDSLRPAFRKIISFLQRGKVFEDFTVLGGYRLISLDGTGFFSSKKICAGTAAAKNTRTAA